MCMAQALCSLVFLYYRRFRKSTSFLGQFSMRVHQAIISGPQQAEIREVDLPEPRENQILVRTHASAISPGTEIAVWTGTHQWLKDPAMPDWKFPFRPGYSAAGE